MTESITPRHQERITYRSSNDIRGKPTISVDRLLKMNNTSQALDMISGTCNERDVAIREIVRSREMQERDREREKERSERTRQQAGGGGRGRGRMQRA